jgi:hypothetical protein
MLEDFTFQQEQDALVSFPETNISANRGMEVEKNPSTQKRQVDVAGLVRQSSRRRVSRWRGGDTCKLETFLKSKEKPGETNRCLHTAGRVEFCILDAGESSKQRGQRICPPVSDRSQETAKTAKEGGQETTESNEEVREGTAEGRQKGESRRSTKIATRLGRAGRVTAPVFLFLLTAPHLSPTIQPLRKAFHSSRSSIAGSIDNARCAGIHVATSPSKAIATTTPVNTSGSQGVA